MDQDQASLAVDALLTYLKKRNEDNNSKTKSLFNDAEDIILQITLKRIPETARTSPYRVPIKHPLYNRDGVEICLFTKDPEDKYKKALISNPIDNVTHVIGVSTLRSDYSRYEDKRDLCSSFSLFMADDRIIPLLPALLTKVFFSRKKQPVPVSLTGMNFRKNVIDARDSTYLFLNTGSCCAVKIANSDFSREQILENLLSAVPSAVDRIPHKWANVQAIHIKSASSISLPIYNTLTEFDENEVIEMPKEKKPSKKRPVEVLEEERKSKKNLAESEEPKEMKKSKKRPVETGEKSESNEVEPKKKKKSKKLPVEVAEEKAEPVKVKEPNKKREQKEKKTKKSSNEKAVEEIATTKNVRKHRQAHKKK